MRYRLLKISSYSAILLAICILSIISIRYYLFELTDYNIYRVLDISFRDFGMGILLLFLHYLLYRKIPNCSRNLWQELNAFRRPWLGVVVIILVMLLLAVILPFGIPSESISVFIGGIIAYAIISHYQPDKILQKNLLLILFGASMGASTIFMMHETENSGNHLKYAQQIAERQDVLAENELQKLIEHNNHNNSEDEWKTMWANSDYLYSNYTFDYHEKTLKIDGSSHGPFHSLVNNISTYTIPLEDSSVVSFTLKRDLRRNKHQYNIPYKALDRLGDYHFALIDRGEIVLTNTDHFDNDIETIPLPSIGIGEKIDWKGFDILVYHHTADTIVIIGEPLSEAQVWLSNFSLFFTIFLFVVLIAHLLKLPFNAQKVRSFWEAATIQFKIRAALTTMTLTLFFVIAGSTFFFLSQNNTKLLSQEEKYLAKYVKDLLTENLQEKGSLNKDLLEGSVIKLAEYENLSIDLYDDHGLFVAGTLDGKYKLCTPSTVDDAVVNRLSSNPYETIQHKVGTCDNMHNRTTLRLSNNDRLLGYVSVQYHNRIIGTDSDIPLIMSSLLNVYVILLLLTWGMGVVLIRLLTGPLGVLAKRLGTFRPGATNQKLEWNSDDAIGKLINEYNNMVDVVEQSTKELVQQEREDAWQNMAQQIAHEINNPLTPLKLNLQFLIRMISEDESNKSSIKHTIVNNLIEQVDHLAKVASQFKSFAMLDNPDVKDISLVDFVKTYINHHKKLDNINYRREFDQCSSDISIIMMDDNHLQTVLDYIYDYAESAIADCGEGFITIRLLEDNGKAVLQIVDNGMYATSNTESEVFDRSFSTNSNSGLGLSICRRIVEYYGGIMNYKSIPGEGTIFNIIFDRVERIDKQHTYRESMLV